MQNNWLGLVDELQKYKEALISKQSFYVIIFKPNGFKQFNNE